METKKKTKLSDLKAFLKFLDYLQEGIIVIDANGIISYMNQYAKQSLGLKDEAIGEHFKEAIKDNYLYSIISHDYEKDNIKEEVFVNGKKFLIKLYKIDNKKFLHLMDITPFEIYKQAKKDFVSNVSHELKTPIAVLKGIIETLETEEKDENKQKFLQMASKRINQMDSLINDLLIIARLESKEDKLIKTKIKLRALISSVYEDLSHIAKVREITFKNLIPEDEVVIADENKLSILFKNLIENALKYNKDGGTVEISIKDSKDYKEIAVKDTGIGIPKNSLPLIFERFYRVDKSRSRNVGGTGLGLSIVKHIVEAHGGKVKVESSIGKGSTFKVYLPKGEK